MKLAGPAVVGVGALLTIAMFTLTDWDAPPIETEQLGYRGLGMVQVSNPRTTAALQAANVVPEEPWELDTSGEEKAGEIYENVQVLGDLTDDQFNRLMAAITEWVSPEQGCAYCHNEENYADDNIYTKIVSRRMLQMTQKINAGWTDHVADVGVTCYTCHRGQPVPPAIWFEQPDTTTGIMGGRAGQNAPSEVVALASLPNDPFTPFLDETRDIRVIGDTALPSGNNKSTKQAEWTYGLMMHMSDSLGVNCTYCHNSRSFFKWEQSTPQRIIAWHGLEMVKAMNADYLVPLGPEYPENRLGPLGDAPKLNCTTCHYGVAKPLYGAPMAAGYPSLQVSAE